MILDSTFLVDFEFGVFGYRSEQRQRETTMTLDWISEKLAMGDRSSCGRIIPRTRQGMKLQKEWRKWQRKTEKSINHARPLWLHSGIAAEDAYFEHSEKKYL